MPLFKIAFTEPLQDVLSHYGYDTVPESVSLKEYTEVMACLFDHYYIDDFVFNEVDEVTNISLTDKEIFMACKANCHCHVRYQPL